MTACGDIEGCWAQDEVNIGWYGYITNVDTSVRVGPGVDFKSRGSVKKGKRVGLQSVRNPHCVNNPAPRPPSHGFSWCYVEENGLTGWVRMSTLDSFDNGRAWARGPADVDFHVGYDKCVTGKAAGCGGHKLPANIRVVDDNEAYLRYAPQSTAYYLLLNGDEVQEFYASPMGYRCVEVKRSVAARVGARGWVISTALN
jgi:hypothetical protein